jgi:hypothetical protein
VLFRSLRPLAGRALAAGTASALALTLFNAAQPSLSARRIHPGTLKTVKIPLAPVPTPSVASGSSALPAGAVASAPPSSLARPVASAPPGARVVAPAPPVDSDGHRTSGSATLPLRGPAPGAGLVKGAPGTRMQSGPVAVGKARFVGFSWPDPDPSGATGEAGLWLRARTTAGWSAWREVEQAADGPDKTSHEYRPGRLYSDGQWLDAGTTEVQVRVDPPAPADAKIAGKAAEAEAGTGAAAVPASGLEAHLITPDMAPTPGTEPARAGVATAATVQPRIVSRAGWGADERIRRADPDYSDTVKAAFVHHTVQSNGYSPSESAALVRADYLYHVRTRGWNDIGYNFLVDRYGRVFEGRYGGITRAVLGAHAGGFNTSTTGVALLGTFTTSRPTSPMLAALERLLAWKLDLTHVDPRGRTVLTSAGGANTRYPAGRRVVVNTILGHRSTSYTTCPGDPTIGLLPRIRSAVSRIGRPKIYGGSATTSRVRPEQGGYAGVHARFSSTVGWKVAVTGSNGATVRSFTGAGSEAKVRWNGRTAGGALARPGGRP